MTTTEEGRTQPRVEPRTVPSDEERRAALRRMKRAATGLLVLAAAVFAVSFALQDDFPWLGYVRAAAEGAMVGAIADWFAVTALFRHPLGIPIPHTAIIPKRKDEIGATLGAFVEDEFLSEEVVVGKLARSESRAGSASGSGGPRTPIGSRPRHPSPRGA